MSNNVLIRRVKDGDAKTLAYIQTTSWRNAFNHILDAETLNQYTKIENATTMYQQLLDKNVGNGYILEINGQAHCIAYWDKIRTNDIENCAELICIHSLPDNWGKGYGAMMMSQVLDDMKKAGYDKAALWVFRENTRAIAFYERFGFVDSGRTQEAFGHDEVMYLKNKLE